jgi:hypothetical protein
VEYGRADELLPLLESRLVGSPAAYALQGEDGRYSAQRLPLTRAVLLGHLAGFHTVGTYIQLSPGRTRHLVLDLDERSPHKASALRHALEHFALHPLVSFSGAKGYHLWVQFPEPVPSARAKRVGQALVASVSRELELPLRCDVYPDGVGELGRVVKLPLGLHRRSGAYCPLLDEELEETDPVALLRAYEAPDPWALECAEEELPLPDLLPAPPTAPPAESTAGFPCLLGISRGVPEGCREVAAFIMAKHLWRLGLSAALIAHFLREWNALNRPPLPEQELETKVLQGHKYRGFGCEQIEGNAHLRGLCQWERCPNRAHLERVGRVPHSLPVGQRNSAGPRFARGAW